MACQDKAEDEAEDEQAEYDSILIENAGEILPSVAKILGGQTFAPYFAGVLPELLKKLVCHAYLCSLFLKTVLVSSYAYCVHISSFFIEIIAKSGLYDIQSGVYRMLSTLYACFLCLNVALGIIFVRIEH